MLDLDTPSAEALRAVFSGEILAPDDAGYDDARRIHNGLIDKRPRLIARCLHTADVVDAVNFGRDEGLEISVRGGGHNVAGKAVTDGGLMVDLSRMKGIHVDPVRQTVRAQAGVLVAELDRATAAFGLATPSGVVSSTGIAGLTLGGGLGWLMSRFGMAVDNLLSAEVVLASGEIVTAGEDADPELFWALRGGGGNFGVVASFEFRAHRVATVLGGPVLHPLAAGPELLALYRDYAADLPDELGTQAALLHAPDGSGAKLCGIAVCHCGEDAQRAEAQTRPVRDFGAPVADMVARVPYPAINTGMDWLFPKGTFDYWTSAFFEELSDEAIAVMIAAFERAPSDLCALVLEDFHGAVTRVDPTNHRLPAPPGRLQFPVDLVVARQVGHRDRHYLGARDVPRAGAHMAKRAYTNYLAADDHEARVREAYGPNYERLVELKRRYDPHNLFHLNQNISPDGPRH